MVLRRVYRRVARSLRKKRPRKVPKKLKKPQRHQADTPPTSGRCLLLELPVEIRHRILEYTLCDAEPIQARHNLVSTFSYESYYDFKHVVEYDAWPNGKPCLEVLSTCRRLNQEGSDIFYNKNTFAITICDTGCGIIPDMDLLGMGEPQNVFITHPRFSKCPNLKLHLSLGRTVSCNTLGYSMSKDSIDGAIEQVYQTWQGRGRLEIEVSQPGMLWVDHQIGASALLHKLGLFRCRSVRFRGVPFSIAYRLKSLIQSDQPALDLQQAFRDLSTFLDKTFIRDDIHEIATHVEAYSKAERFAAFYDAENFMLARAEAVETALQRMKASFDRVQTRGVAIQSEGLPTPTGGERVDLDLSPFPLINGL